ncbi:efflux RND transporter periplasmic adaptor subunit (plasmid) [Adhaeribacter swui]|uniref:Efflux RND transporter periplasmic adaptor subunit n=1 Tax=Adhaeribacter swui TaxID=2086471 RepID=A0A7G7G288_9BACT|nr:efflux RND transporter periplasmic adaptor subunit [Adhaeribacter swui]QNF31272.1 efflux RND transporter periplasmic adaptor subunit [Adhaeribacter swui]
MRKNWKNKIIGLLILLVPFTFTACKENHNHEAETAAGIEYTCPMHPQIVRDKPGDCPVCGMTLVAKQTASTPATAISSDLNYLLQPANQTVVSNVKTTQPIQKQVQNEILLSGVVTYDTRQQSIIPARFGGRIEKLYVQFNYQLVRKGQKLYDIYSPELVTAQKELVYLLKNDPSNTSLINGAKQKLQLLGATSGQINQLIQSGQENYTFSVYSPYTGYVLDPAITAAPAPTAPATSSASGGDGMNSMGSGTPSTSGSMGVSGNSGPTTPSNGFAVREGMYVTTGQALLKVIDASQVWAQFNVASSQAKQLTKGTPITISFNQLPGQTVSAKVSLVEPVYEAQENFARVRASLPTQDKSTLIGQLITGKASYNTGTALWVPKESVLDLGTQSVAFLKVNGVFKPQSVQVGERANGMVEVLSGLSAKNVIAANAQFLVDSESFIRVAENNK